MFLVVLQINYTMYSVSKVFFKKITIKLFLLKLVDYFIIKFYLYYVGYARFELAYFSRKSRLQLDAIDHSANNRCVLLLEFESRLQKPKF